MPQLTDALASRSSALPSPGSGRTPSSSAVSSSHSLAAAGADSVRLWLTELRWYVEADCSNVLHSKAIPQPAWLRCQPQLQQRLPGTPQPPPKACRGATPASPAASVHMLEVRSQSVLSEFNNVFQCIQRSQLKRVHAAVRHLTDVLRSFLHDMHYLLLAPSQTLQSHQQQLLDLCGKLDTAGAELLNLYLYTMTLPAIESRFLVVNGHLPSVQPVLLLLSEATGEFGQLLDQGLLELLAVIVHAITHKTSGANFTSALQDLLRLAMRSDRLSCLVARARAVEALVQVCDEPCLKKYWPIALRTVAAVCCVDEAISVFEQAGGMAVVSSILDNHRNSQLMRAEAAGVVAQVTSPCVSKGKEWLGSLSSHTEELIRSLTLLCREATGADVFLLSSAAIANITFISPASFEYMLKYNSVQVLVSGCQLSKADSLFAKDQVATVLANMAAFSWCHANVTRQNGIELLLHFLSESPGCYGDAGSRAACERLQQKAAIAIGRLARDPANSQIVVELDGAGRLAELCRRPEERNCSDSVLVAALACLRHIHDAVGSEEMDASDLRDLVRPRLCDAFLSCSRLDESYV